MIKRVISTITLLSLSAISFAQNKYIAPIGAIENNNGIEIVTPRSTLAIDFVEQKEMVYAGPYARYAQKYLGQRAAFTDKATYKLLSVNIALTDPDSNIVAPAIDAAPTIESKSYLTSQEGFVALLPDKTSTKIVSLEQSAMEAAEMIFKIRKTRQDFLTGALGENVFGEGFKEAMKRLDDMEQQYQELFMGKVVVTTQTKRYMVNPSIASEQYMVCRFSDETGLIPSTDLSGGMVMLQITPSGKGVAVAAADPKSGSTADVKVADISTCTLLLDGKELSSEELPIFEFGRVVRVELPKRK